MDSEVRHLKLRTGITVPCFIHGDAAGYPVLLLHPWGETGGTFDRLIPLMTGLRVYAPDLRGQGGADKPAGGYSLMEQAGDAAAILDALDVPEAFVVGSSSGGYVAQQLAVTHPGKVAALVLAGAPLTLQGRPAFADQIDVLTDPLDEDWVRNLLTWFPLLHDVPSWFIEDRVSDALRIPAHAWQGILYGLCDAVPPTDSGSIQAPTLILWGAQDGLLSRQSQEALAARIANAVLKIYAGVGHLVLWECPEQIAADTTAFFTSLNPGRLLPPGQLPLPGTGTNTGPAPTNL